MDSSNRPWSIHTIHDMIGSHNVMTPFGRAVPVAYPGRRILKAWWVLTGRAEAVIWPKPGDLEVALHGCRREGKHPSPGADDIRAQGWSVAVHNDYRLNGELHTFWLFTKDGRAIKGEGRTDAEALNAIRAALAGEPTT